MALTITDTQMTSDLTPARAEFRPDAAGDGQGAWVVYGAARADQLFDRNQAITVMTIEEEQAKPFRNHALIASLESELR